MRTATVVDSSPASRLAPAGSCRRTESCIRARAGGADPLSATWAAGDGSAGALSGAMDAAGGAACVATRGAAAGVGAVGSAGRVVALSMLSIEAAGSSGAAAGGITAATGMTVVIAGVAEGSGGVGSRGIRNTAGTATTAPASSQTTGKRLPSGRRRGDAWVGDGAPLSVAVAGCRNASWIRLIRSPSPAVRGPVRGCCGSCRASRTCGRRPARRTGRECHCRWCRCSGRSGRRASPCRRP